MKSPAVCIELEKAQRILVATFKDVGLHPRDVVSLLNRSTQEGFSFLTKTLPILGKAIDNGLIVGRFSLPCNFKRRYKGSQIPAFCGSLIALVFDDHGFLRDNACITAIKNLRQVCFTFYKYETEFDPIVCDEMLDNFATVDEDILPVNSGQVINDAAALSAVVFNDFCPEALIMENGPGATADVRITDKFSVRPGLLHPITVKFGYHHWYTFDQFQRYMLLLQFLAVVYMLLEIEVDVPQKAMSAKVVFVPKDSRGPRIISKEPALHQYVQQGIEGYLTKKIASHPISRGRVNFRSQEVNRNLALLHSTDKLYSTLDLKEASDRISFDLVKRMFGGCANDLLSAMILCRTSTTEMRYSDGSTSLVHLNKWAPMGSALCFPVMSWCIYALLYSSMEYYRTLSNPVETQIYVFGDDIIVPTWYAPIAKRVLEEVGLLVNSNKSCVNSNFLESCGMDAFKGVQVTPVRAKKIVSCAPKDSVRWVSNVMFSNQLFEAGYTRTAFVVAEITQKVLGNMPRGNYPGILGFDNNENIRYESGNRAGERVRGRWSYVVKSPRSYRETGDYDHLRRIFPLLGTENRIPERGFFELPRTAYLRRKFIPMT